MSFWSPALLSGLTLGDYLLWNWSLNANHDVMALIAGLSLPALALASLWLVALSVLRLIGSSTRRSTREAPSAGHGAVGKAHAAEDGARAPASGTSGGLERPPTSASPPAPSSGKLAA